MTLTPSTHGVIDLDALADYTAAIERSRDAYRDPVWCHHHARPSRGSCDQCRTT